MDHSEFEFSESTDVLALKKWKKILSIIVLQIFVFVQINPAWASSSFESSSCLQSKADSCIDNTPCKSIGGVTVCLAGASGPSDANYIDASCWNYAAEFQCRDSTYLDTCANLVSKNCAQVDSQCQTGPNGLPMLVNGQCTVFTQTYQCQTSPPVSRQVQDCSASTVCGSDGSCWATPTKPDEDFANAAGRMELVRQASVYMSTGGTMFDGDAESCTEGYGGLRKCCDADAKGQSNAQSLKSTGQQVALSAAWKYGKEAAVQGSPYVYDFMFKAGIWAESGVNAMLGSSSNLVGGYVAESAAMEAEKAALNGGASSAGGAAGAAGSGGIGAYGVTYGAIGSNAAAGTVIGSGAGTLGGPLYSLGGGFAFDPVSLGIAIAIMVIMKMMACTPDEAMLQMHKGSNLCTSVGSYCSKKILGACSITTQAYCCYNSILSRLINEQGRPQIGKGYGSPQNPDCSGFTIAQVQSIDFSRIDLSDFTNTIIPNLSNLPDAAAISGEVSARQTDRATNGPVAPGGAPPVINPAIPPIISTPATAPPVGP